MIVNIFFNFPCWIDLVFYIQHSKQGRHGSSSLGHNIAKMSSKFKHLQNFTYQNIDIHVEVLKV